VVWVRVKARVVGGKSEQRARSGQSSPNPQSAQSRDTVTQFAWMGGVWLISLLIVAGSIAQRAGAVNSPTSPTTSPTASPAVIITRGSGSLRIRNRSAHPVRVAMLLRSVKANTDEQASYDPPAHWDFEPWEGRERGLLVALSSRTVRIKKGDVLVAFAQDGSQRYWGPFVAGETKQPLWNPATEEWEMVLSD
jgi:hypothetical protein